MGGIVIKINKTVYFLAAQVTVNELKPWVTVSTESVKMYVLAYTHFLVYIAITDKLHVIKCYGVGSSPSLSAMATLQYNQDISEKSLWVLGP